MKFRTWGYVFREAGRGVRRNRQLSLVSATTVAVCLVMLGVFNLLALNLDHLALTLERQVEIVAYLANSVTAEAAQAMAEQLAAVPGVDAVTYVSRDEALRRLMEQFGDKTELLEGIDQHNPLEASLEISVGDAARVEPVARLVAELQGVTEVDYGANTVAKLFTFTRALRLVGLALVGLLTIGATFLISNTIRITIFARRREISIMKLVGATDWFIRWPFMMEGIIIGLSGTALAVGALWFGYSYLVNRTAEAMPFVPLLNPWVVVPLTAGILAAFGIGMGLVGSFTSLRRYLNS
ncbi:MAG: permease-like cell division protein FtsX [Bacillota bacterium]